MVHGPQRVVRASGSEHCTYGPLSWPLPPLLHLLTPVVTASSDSADYTEKEFAKLRSTKMHAPSQYPVAQPAASNTANPPTFDWRSKGAVTDVKNQVFSVQCSVASGQW